MQGIQGIGNKGNLNLLATGKAKFTDDMFLKLLVAEMKTQSPLEPIDNKSFMEQMAQFSSMAQTREMNDSLLQLLSYQGFLARMQGLDQGAKLLGKIVEYKDDKGKEGSGEVKGVKVEDGKVLLELDKKTIELGWVTGIRAKGKNK